MIYDAPQPNDLEAKERIVSPHNLRQRLGDDIRAISQDTPSEKYFEQSGPNFWYVATGVDAPYYNIGLVNDAEGVNPADTIRDLIELAAARNLPSLITFPGSFYSAEVKKAIIADKCYGGGPYETTPHMLLEPVSKIEPAKAKVPITISQAATLDELQAAITMQIDAFGFPEGIRETMGAKVLSDPRVKVFLAHTADGTLASSVMTVTHEDGVVGVWNMVTRQELQRNGIGAEFLTEVINQCMDNGGKAFQLLATPDGEPLYNKMGFKTVEQMHDLIYQPNPQEHEGSEEDLLHNS